MSAVTVETGIVRLPSGSFRSTVSHGAGRRTTETHATIEEARAWRAAELLTRKHGARNTAPIAPSAARALTVEAYWPRWLDDRAEMGKHRESTREQAESHLRNHVGPLIGKRPLVDLTAAPVLSQFATELTRRGISANTQALVFANVVAMLNHAHDVARLIPSGPPKIANRPVARRDKTKIRIVDEDEAREIVSAAEAAGSRYAPLWLTLEQTGMRIGEALGLSVRDVDLRGRLLRVERQWTRKRKLDRVKDDEARYVGLTPRLAAALVPLVEGRDGDAPLFTAPEGGRINAHNLVNRGWDPIVLPLMERGLVREPKPYFHAMRHGAVSRMLAEGVATTDIMQITGHESLSTMQIYSHALGGSAHRGAAAFAKADARRDSTPPRAKGKRR